MQEAALRGSAWQHALESASAQNQQVLAAIEKKLAGTRKQAERRTGSDWNRRCVV